MPWWSTWRTPASGWRRWAGGWRPADGLLTTPNPRLQLVHDAGARLGLFSRAGAAEHQSLLDPAAMARLAADASLAVVHAARFLAGANQLFVLAAAAERRDD